MAFLSQDYMMLHHNYLDENNHHHQHEDPSVILSSSCPPQEFQGVPSFSMMNRSMSFSEYQLHQLNHDNNHDHDHDDHGGGDQDDLSDDGSQVLVVGSGRGEKKKRLNMEQVKTLEKSFEQGNKLEPERKMQLAKALGLQPRQVAIWFQNRRARWKTKQLEKDYSVLKRQFDSLKADNTTLLSQNKKLHAELICIKNREATEYGAINLNHADTKSYWSNNGSDISSDMNLNNNNNNTVTPRTGSPLSSNPTNKQEYPSNSYIPTSITQLLQSTTPKPEIDLHDHTFCNMYAATNENQPPPFWAWPDQQQQQQQHLN